MKKPYTVLSNTELSPESKKPHDHPEFISNCGDYFSIEEAELRAILLKRKYPQIKVSVLDHQLQQLIEIHQEMED